MTVLIRLTATLILVVGTLVGLGYCQPSLVAGLGIDFWNLPILERNLADAAEVSHQLDEMRARNKAVVETKERLIQELIHEQLPLAEAVAHVCQISDREQLEMAANCLDIYELQLSATVGKLLIHWVELELRYQPVQAAQSAARLNKELAELCQTGQ